MVNGKTRAYKRVLAGIISAVAVFGFVALPVAAALPQQISGYNGTSLNRQPNTAAGTVLMENADLSTDSVINVADSTTASGTNWTFAEGVFTVTGNVTVTGTTYENRINVTGRNAIVTLNNVRIIFGDPQNMSPIDVSNAGAATITLAPGSTNDLVGGIDSPGIYVPLFSQVTIDGSGTLNASAGRYGAGIGGRLGFYDTTIAISGTIIINDGIINAKGGERSAGIGGADGGSDKPRASGGRTIINGGIVTAIAGSEGAGIGGGSGGAGGYITINGGMVTAIGGGAGGAGIGGGGKFGQNPYGNGGTIIINGGTVNAKGGGESGNYGGAGIGGGGYSAGGNIVITGGNVTTEGGSGAAGIGGGCGGAGENISITGGTIKSSATTIAAGIGGGYTAGGGNIKISGGTVTSFCEYDEGVNIGNGSRYNGGSANIVIDGGSVNALRFSDTPKNSSGETLYLGKLDNQAGVKSASVDEFPYNITENHINDNSLYLFMAAKDHAVDVQTSAGVSRYTATWQSENETFVFGEETEYGDPEQTGLSLLLSKNIVEYGRESGITVTATVTDSTLGVGMLAARTAGINQVSFYLNGADEPFATSAVVNGKATALLGVANIPVGSHSIKAVYGGSYGGETSQGVANLTVEKMRPTSADFLYDLPIWYFYNGNERGVSPIYSLRAGFTITALKYNGSTTVPVNAGTYTVTIDVAGNENYSSATDVILGTYAIAKATPSLMAAAPSIVTRPNHATLEGSLPSNATGTLTFKMGDTVVGTTILPENSIEFAPQDAANQYNFTVTYSGDDNYNAKTSDALQIDFLKSDQQDLIVQKAQMNYKETIDLSDLVEGGSGSGVLRFNILEGPGRVQGTQFVPTSAGEVRVGVLKEGDNDYNPKNTYLTVKVNPRIIDFVLSDIGVQTYTGSPVTPLPTVFDGNTVLTNGVDYICEYQNNINVGSTATLQLYGIGGYAGSSALVTFSISIAQPSAASTPSVSAASSSSSTSNRASSSTSASGSMPASSSMASASSASAATVAPVSSSATAINQAPPTTGGSPQNGNVAVVVGVLLGAACLAGGVTVVIIRRR